MNKEKKINNNGRKEHRSCIHQCVSGGIKSTLYTITTEQSASFFFLTMTKAKRINLEKKSGKKQLKKN